MGSMTPLFLLSEVNYECEFWEEPKMNERIKELAIQAGLNFGTNISGVELVYGTFEGSVISHIDSDELEKFVELIVKECAEQIIAKGTDWVDFAPSQTGVRPEYWDMAQQIKKHFGVEE